MITIIPDPPFMLPEPLGSMVQTLVWPLFYWTGIIAGPEAIFVFLVALLLAPLYVGAAVDFIRLRQLRAKISNKNFRSQNSGISPP